MGQPLLQGSSPLIQRQPRQTRLLASICVLLFLFSALTTSSLLGRTTLWDASFLQTTRASASLHHDLAQCHRDQSRPDTPARPAKSRLNPRSARHRPFLLRNVTLIDGDGSVHPSMDVHVRQGTIMKVSRTEQTSAISGGEVIDLEGRYLSPGIVGESSIGHQICNVDRSPDMHSHLGTWSQPRYEKGQDMEELSGPITPHFRAIDGFDPSDEALPRVVSD